MSAVVSSSSLSGHNVCKIFETLGTNCWPPKEENALREGGESIWMAQTLKGETQKSRLVKTIFGKNEQEKGFTIVDTVLKVYELIQTCPTLLHDPAFQKNASNTVAKLRMVVKQLHFQKREGQFSSVLADYILQNRGRRTLALHTLKEGFERNLDEGGDFRLHKWSEIAHNPEWAKFITECCLMAIEGMLKGQNARDALPAGVVEELKAAEFCAADPSAKNMFSELLSGHYCKPLPFFHALQFNDPKTSDWKITVSNDQETRSYSIHREVLSLFSNYFPFAMQAPMREQNFSEIAFKHHGNLDNVEMMLKRLYGEGLVLSEANITELYTLGHGYEIPGVIIACEEWILDHLDEINNLQTVLELFDTHRAHKMIPPVLLFCIKVLAQQNRETGRTQHVRELLKEHGHWLETFDWICLFEGDRVEMPLEKLLLEVLPYCSNLKTLDLAHATISPAILRCIGNSLLQLESLNLSHCKNISRQAIVEHLQKLKNIKILNLNHSMTAYNLGLEDIKPICALFPRLEFLGVAPLSQLSISCNVLSENFFQEFRLIAPFGPRLKILDLGLGDTVSKQGVHRTFYALCKAALPHTIIL